MTLGFWHSTKASTRPCTCPATHRSASPPTARLPAVRSARPHRHGLILTARAPMCAGARGVKLTSTPNYCAFVRKGRRCVAFGCRSTTSRSSAVNAQRQPCAALGGHSHMTCEQHVLARAGDHSSGPVSKKRSTCAATRQWGATANGRTLHSQNTWQKDCS